jgi:hypothetical protein
MVLMLPKWRIGRVNSESQYPSSKLAMQLSPFFAAECARETRRGCERRRRPSRTDQVQRHSGTPVLYVVSRGLDLARIRMQEFGRLALDSEDRFHLLEAVVPVVDIIIEISICELAMMERTQPSSGQLRREDGARHVGEVRISGDA